MRRHVLLALLALAASPARPSGPTDRAANATEPAQAAAPTIPAEELLRRATTALESGDLAIATALFAELRQADPKKPAGWFGGGLAAEAAGDLGSAVELVAQAVELDPERVAVHLAHGRLLARSGAAGPARAAFARARKLDPGDPDGYLFAALLLRDGGSFSEAEALLREGIARAAPRPEFWDQLGLVLLSQQKPDEALAAVEDSLTRYPATPRLELVRGLALAADPGRREAAIASLEQAIAGGEGGARGRMQLAELLIAAERVGDAVVRLEEAADMAPADPQAHYLLGQALRQAGRTDEAAAALNRFQELRLERDAANARAKRLGARFNTAIEHIQASRLDEALIAVNEILAEAPDHARTLALKAKLLFSTGDVDGAYRFALDARSQDSTLSEHHYLEGLFAYHLGKLEAAQSALARALAIDPDLGEAHEVAAVVALSLERPAESVTHFERAIALGVDHEELRRAYALALEAARKR